MSISRRPSPKKIESTGKLLTSEIAKAPFIILRLFIAEFVPDSRRKPWPNLDKVSAVRSPRNQASPAFKVSTVTSLKVMLPLTRKSPGELRTSVVGSPSSSEEISPLIIRLLREVTCPDPENKRSPDTKIEPALRDSTRLIVPPTPSPS